ncbi:MAG TPA: pilus assembly protein PilM [Armatimonadota bacterium]
MSWGLDLGSSAVKLVKVEDNGGKLRATSYGPVPIAQPGPKGGVTQELARSLEKLFQLSGGRPGGLHCCLPRLMATVKFPHLPRAPREQLAGMVRLDAQRYIPFPLEEVVLGFLELPQTSAEPLPGETEGEPVETPATPAMSHVLLVAVREEVVHRYRAPFAGLGGKPASLSISSLGAWEVFKLASQRGEASSKGAYLLLDLGGHSTTVSIVMDGVLVFSRSVGVGGDGLTAAYASTYDLDTHEAESMKVTRGLSVLDSAGGEDAGPPAAIEDWYSRLVMEVRRSTAAFSAEMRHVEVQGVLVMGGTANLPGLVERLEGELGLPVVPAPTAGLCRDPQFVEATGQALLGLGPSPGMIDLVPEEEERRRQQTLRRWRMRAAGLAAAALLAVGAVWGAGVLSEEAKQREIVELAQKRAAKVEAEASGLKKERDKLRQQLSDAESALHPQSSWLDVMQEISSRTPADVWLVAITLEKGKPMVLRGIAKVNTSPPTMTSALGRSGLFDNVNLGSASEAKVGDQTVVNFGITGQVKGNLPKPKKSVKTRTRKTSTR